MALGMISVIVFLPLLAALGVFLLNALFDADWIRRASRALLIATSAGGLVLSVLCVFLDTTSSESISWIPSLGIQYSVAIGGLNAIVILVVGLVGFFASLLEVSDARSSETRLALLVLSVGLFQGAACSQDLVLILLFWVAATFPLYFLIAGWGMQGRTQAAARLLGRVAVSAALLVMAVIVVVSAGAPKTLILSELMQQEFWTSSFGLDSLGLTVVALISGAVVVQLPVWPFHGWFVSAVKVAPTSVIAILLGVWIPVCVSLFFRVVYVITGPQAVMVAPALEALGAVCLIGGVISIAAQKSIRGILGYAAVAQTGVLLIGINSLSEKGVLGAQVQLFTTGAALGLFSILFGVIERRTEYDGFGEEDPKRLKGLSYFSPLLAVAAAVCALSLVGLPGTVGFVGQALILMGSYESGGWWSLVVVAALVVFVTILFSAYRNVFLTEKDDALTAESFKHLVPLCWVEKAAVVPLILLLLFFGFFPRPIVHLAQEEVDATLKRAGVQIERTHP